MIATITNTDYFLFAHSETKKSVPLGIKGYWIRFLSSVRSLFLFNNTSEAIYKASFMERLMNMAIFKIQHDFTAINLELKAILNEIVNNKISVDQPKEAYETMQKVISLLTKADNLFSNTSINYFGNETLKFELESSLRTSYKIEVKLKRIIIESKKETKQKDPLFELLASQSKDYLLRAI